VLSELREDSRTKAVWDGDFDDNLASLADCAGVEFKDSASYSSWSSIEFKDPHAQKLFGAKAGGATLSPSPSKESLKDQQREGSSRPNSKGVSPLLRSKTLPSKETQKPTTHRMSLTFMITHEEHRKNVPSIASRVIGASPILGAIDIPISKQQLCGCMARLNEHPWDSITNISLRRESKDMPLLPEEAFEKEHFPWLPAKPLFVTYTYPDLTAIFAPSLRSALVNTFNIEEIQTIYDMFKEYETHHALEGKEPEAVIHSLDCESCVFWVGILADPELVAFCSEAVEMASFALCADIHRDSNGKPLYTVEQFFRWMLNFRVKYRVDWIKKAGLADVTIRHLHAIFVEFDKTGEGLKTKQVFELLERIGRRPVTVEDQRRVVEYIEESDVDGSGTIDFLEFLQLLRMDHNDFAMKKRRLEMKVINSTGMVPDQVNNICTLFDNADADMSGVLTFKQIKKAFSTSEYLGTTVQLDKDQMDSVSERVDEAKEIIAKISGEKVPKKRITEDVLVNFAEFALAMHLLCVHDKSELREIAHKMLTGIPHLSNWIDARRPNANELQSRWELKMMMRHLDAYQVLISDGKYRPSERLGRRLFELTPGLPDRAGRAAPSLTWAAIENTELYGDDASEMSAAPSNFIDGDQEFVIKRRGVLIQPEDKLVSMQNALTTRNAEGLPAPSR
jgi:hypothetical protein